MSDTRDQRASSTLDASEVAQFSRLAARWWNPDGEFRMLHRIGPARLQFLRDRMVQHLRPAATGLRALQDLTVLDIGCGGGLIAEPLTRLGARVTGLDPSPETIAAARAHAEAQDLDIDYRVGRVEDLVAEGRTFDAVLCLEVVEHVPDVGAFLATCAKLVRPGGMMLLSTINRTLKSYALAIVGAEYILRWLPAGTHHWHRFVTPDELAGHIVAAGLEPATFEGLTYDPLRDTWRPDAVDLDVNYQACATRRTAP